MTGAPTWYDVLDVDAGASSDEIRTAWKAQIADLEPGDRRFDALNRAAKVLLDPATRAEYDAGLPAAQPESEEALEVDRAAAPQRGVEAVERRPGERQAPAARTRHPLAVPTWLVAGLAFVAVALVAATTWVWLSGASSLAQLPGAPGDDGAAARAAQTAAERAVVPVLSYDYEDLDGGQERAQAMMTGAYREEYDKLYAVIAENAPTTRTKVGAEVVASGIVRATEDRVQVLVFVDRPTTNKASTEPVVYKDQVTLSMQRVDGEWLVDDMITSPVTG